MRIIVACSVAVLTTMWVGCDQPGVNAEKPTVADQKPVTDPSGDDQNPVAGQTAVGKDEVVATDQDESADIENPIKEAKTDEDADKKEPKSYNVLNAMEAYVILRKGTERRSEGGYTKTKDPGTYICRQCNAKLFQADHKFESDCGWPSFDDEIKGAVKRNIDEDGYRVEIVCANCQGHLGHVFEGERYTSKNIRHCVNSISLKFIPKGKEIPKKIVINDQAVKNDDQAVNDDKSDSQPATSDQ